MTPKDRAKAYENSRRVLRKIATLHREAVHISVASHAGLEQPRILQELQPVLVHMASNPIAKTVEKYAAHGWDTPIASQAIDASIQLLEKQLSIPRSSPRYDHQLRQSNLDLVNCILRSAHDGKSILQISTFSNRMALCKIRNGIVTFESGLQPYEVISLMHNGVFAVSVSYKHTRICTAELTKDISRVHMAIERTAKELSLDRLLFWCDIVGWTPQGISWAETQGLDPYLCMPTLRVVSAALGPQIEDSFWMTAERVAATLRGGLLTYDEDLQRLRIDQFDKTVTYPSEIWLPFELVKPSLAKIICNPDSILSPREIQGRQTRAYEVWDSLCDFGRAKCLAAFAK